MAHIQIWNSIKSLRRKNDDPLNDCSAFDFSDELDDDDPRYSRMQAVASDDSTDTMVDISANGPHLGPLSDDESLLDRAIALRGTQTGPGRDPNRDPCDNCNRQRELLKQRKVKRQLFLAAVLYFLFMTGELIGGYVANSLAIMTDALHMLTDLSGIILTLLALWLSGKSPTKRFTFGFHRLEVLSAMFSVLLIYILMVFLLYEAVQRTIHMDYEINGDIMLITAAIGVAVNLIMGFLLNQTGHLHSHSHAPASVPANPSSTTSGHGHAHGSLAVRAAFVHALGDLVQSIGVLVAAYIIRFKPEYKIADPICTYVFSLLVAFTTFQIVRDTGIIVLEGVPKHLNVDRVKEELMKIEDVFSVENLHLWCLTAGKIIAVVHLQLVPGGSSKWEEVQSKARRLLLTTFGMHQCSIQLQSYRRDEDKPCANCQISSA